MGFSNYKDLAVVLKELNIRHEVENEYLIHSSTKASQHFKDELDFTLKNVPYQVSEFAICENLVFPILREVWKPYAPIFTIWSRAFLQVDDKINGYPDYYIAKRSALGVIVPDRPILAVVEAKKDDFSGAWGQNLMEMHAIQQLNQQVNKHTQIPVYGIATSGIWWQFGKLTDSVFTQFETSFDIKHLDMLFAAIDSVLIECKSNMEKL